MIEFDNRKIYEHNFLNYLIKLSPEQACGIARMINVNLVDDKEQPKEALTLVNDLLEKFKTLTTTQKKNLLELMRAATQGGKKQRVTKNKKNHKRTRH